MRGSACTMFSRVFAIVSRVCRSADLVSVSAPGGVCVCPMRTADEFKLKSTPRTLLSSKQAQVAISQLSSSLEPEEWAPASPYTTVPNTFTTIQPIMFRGMYHVFAPLGLIPAIVSSNALMIGSYRIFGSWGVPVKRPSLCGNKTYLIALHKGLTQSKTSGNFS